MTTPETQPPAPAPPPLPRHRTRLRLILVAVLLSPLVVLGLYAFLALHWSYSDGYRAGVLQKFSRKGWVCKTWEGELAQSVVVGVAPVIWEFSVRNDSIAREMSRVLGRKVSLHYQEHRGVPTTCFGMTSYFVDSVAVLE